MRKNAASALAATVIIDGVVNHCGDEVCKWTCRGKRGREMGRIRYGSLGKTRTDYVGVTLICNLTILLFPCITTSNICPQFKTVLPAAVFSVDSKNALLHPSIGLLLSAPSFPRTLFKIIGDAWTVGLGGKSA